MKSQPWWNSKWLLWSSGKLQWEEESKLCSLHILTSLSFFRFITKLLYLFILLRKKYFFPQVLLIISGYVAELCFSNHVPFRCDISYDKAHQITEFVSVLLIWGQVLPGNKVSSLHEDTSAVTPECSAYHQFQVYLVQDKCSGLFGVIFLFALC